jgi:hypothetical protein
MMKLTTNAQMNSICPTLVDSSTTADCSSVSQHSSQPNFGPVGEDIGLKHGHPDFLRPAKEIRLSKTFLKERNRFSGKFSRSERRPN